VDGLEGPETGAAVARFARRQGLPRGAGLFSKSTQMALNQVCGGATAALPDRPPVPPR
jgi:hypothetical protein